MIRLALRASIFVFTCFLAAAGFEIYLQLTEISLPPIVNSHPKVGRTFVPGARIIALEEGFYLGQANQYSYLGPGYPPERQAATTRIAVIGDSYVEGFQLFARHNFLTTLEQELEALQHDKVEVLNFGRSGADFRTMYIYYKDFAQQFDPDFVFFVVTYSDFYGKDEGRGPQCAIKDGNLIIDYSFANTSEFHRSVRFRPGRSFAFYAMLQKARSRYQSGKLGSILLDKLYPHSNQEPAYVASDKDFSDPYIDLNQAVMRSLSQTNNSSHTQFVLVFHGEIPDSHQDFANEQGLRSFHVKPILDGLRKKGINPIYWQATDKEGHWNHDAHKAIGNALAQKVFEWNQEPASP